MKNGGKHKKKKKKKKKKASRRNTILPMSPLGFSKKLAQDDDGDEEGAMELNDRLRYSKNDQNDIVAQAKTTICDILVTVVRIKATQEQMSSVIIIVSQY